MPALPLRNKPEIHSDAVNLKARGTAVDGNLGSSELSLNNHGPLQGDAGDGHDGPLISPSFASQSGTNLQQSIETGFDSYQSPVPKTGQASQEELADEDGFSLLLSSSSSSQSFGRMKRAHPGTLSEKKLSVISVRDSELDLIGLAQDYKPSGDGTLNGILNGTLNINSIGKEKSHTELSKSLETSTDIKEPILSTAFGNKISHSEPPLKSEAARSNNAHSFPSEKSDFGTRTSGDAGQLPSSSSPHPSTRQRSRQCCGGHTRPAIQRTEKQQQGQGLVTENHIQVNTSPKILDPSKLHLPSTSEHAESPSADSSVDSSISQKDNLKNHQEGGLFKILLKEGKEDMEMLLDDENKADKKIQEDNTVTMVTSETSGEELTPRPPSADQQPAPKKRRKASGRRALCADPFAKLPRVKLRPFLWAEDSEDEMPCEAIRRRRKASTRNSPKLVDRRARQFDDPFKELAFVVFDSADVDCDKRLRRAEFASILKSPSLDLELSTEDIRRLEKDCSKGRKDIRDLPVSFDEFLPLARHLLMLYYNKQDSNSRNPWSILDRGRVSPPYYFNKHTGQVSADRPLDYDHQPELYLFEKALQDAFEIADMDKDGKIHLNDFIRIVNSEDFGLILTKNDIAEITKHFKNEAGKVGKVCYAEFLPLAKRLIVAVFSARSSLEDEWSFLHTRHVGAFWFNKRTGQSFRHPPNHIVTMQQQQLRHRKQEVQALVKTSEELKVTKAKLEEETTLRKDFEEKYTSLSSEHAIASRELQKITRLYDKCRIESEKRSILLDANEKEKAKLLHKIEQLEQRVADAERTETNLESMRDVLKNCQGALREHELDIKSLQAKIEDLNKQLSESEARVEDGQGVIADLHRQLREEIKRNEKMETELKKVPDIKKELQEEKESLQLCQKRLEERNAVLTLTRQVNQENKAKIKTLEEELTKLPAVEGELEMAQCEIYTLKQLLVGKDSLVAQKSQELDSVKGRLELDQGKAGGAGSEDRTRGRGLRNGYSANGVNFRVVRLQKRSSKGMQVGPHSKESKSTHNSSQIDVSTPPYDSSSSGSQSDSKHQKSNNHLLSERPASEDTIITSMSTSNGGFLRLLQKQGSAEQDMPTIYDLYTPEGSYMPTANSSSPALKNGAHPRPKSSMARLGAEESSVMQKGTLMFEDDFLVAQFLQVGDRVRIKKKGGKHGGAIQSGIVKFIGKVDKEYNHNDHRLYAGIRLDEAVGDTDGVIKGKRYFTVNPRHGKLVPITNVISVLNTKTSTYKSISESIRAQRLETGTAQYEKDRNPQLIRVK